jgi:TetR/AcrR family transcriptional repressor of nem operon
MPPAKRTDTAQRILDVAERLAQTHGFNGFSYADVATKLRITKASLHYHFRTKAELGRNLVARYHERFHEALVNIDRGGGEPMARLQAYVELYAEVLRRDRMCLCGMLAADAATLPRPMRDAVRRFFDDNEEWLSAILEHGRASGTLQFGGQAYEVARLLVSSLEGALLVARSYGDVDRFLSTAARLLAEMVPLSAPPRPAAGRR